MRLFVSIVPPEEVLTQLDEFVEPRRLVADGPRWISKRYWHLTLAFMGKVAERDLIEVEDRLAEVAQRTRPFELALRGAGVFPDPTRAKVLWAGVDDDGAEPLAQLAQRCRTAVGRAGVKVDGATFRPHLTLARWRVPVEATRWLKALGEYESVPWTVDSFELVHSQLGHAGPPHYETVAEYQL
ncbi:RNA 2',3'-cyclic phosphodiesterase [Enemella sp. A6]|uniref:RNA 2',3'-cyclic phosphodiesterase n=1 Tax=Enemella sp. A6 TaxID=3440152 RepID=UPI003EB728B1